MPRRRRSVSPSPPPRRFAPALRHRPPCLTPHQFLRRLGAQRQQIAQLIVVFGPSRRIQVRLSRRLDAVVTATLEVCLGLQDLFWGGFDKGDSDERFYFSVRPALEQGFDDLPALEDIRR